MLSKLLQFLLAITSVSPIFITLWFIEFSKNWFWGDGLFYLALVVILTGMALIIINVSKSKLEKFPIKIKSLSPSDKEAISFIFVYLLPLIFTSAISVNFYFLLFIVVLFFFSVFTTHIYHFNPILGLFGYHYYTITNEGDITYILMTKRTIRNTKEINKVAQISEYMLLDSGGD
ncbi:MAG: hypothetical protein QXK49_00265 [Candidatus Aenigmatarchaeota archaeon]